MKLKKLLGVCTKAERGVGDHIIRSVLELVGQIDLKSHRQF